MNKTIVILIYAFIGWLICFLIMGIGQLFLPINTVLIIHLIGGPIAFILLSYHYHKKFNYTKPIYTALIFVSFVILVDFFVVALIILKSLDMFRSLIGTWIPFCLIFLSTYLTGLLVQKRK